MVSGKTIYYPVWIAPGRKAGGWSWGKPCDTPKEADQIIKEKFLSENATLGCVVQMSDGEKILMANHIKPPSARRIVEHWENLWDATES